jgi:beta-lactamase class A
VTRQVTRRPTKVRPPSKSPHGIAKTSQKHRPPQKRRQPSPLSTVLIHTLRVAILGAGLGAIAGTVLTVIDPPKIPFFFPKTIANPLQTTPTSLVTAKPTTLAFQQDLPALKQKLETLAAKYPKLQAGAVFIDLDNGSYANFQGDTLFAAASTIKVPILVAFFEKVDAGTIRLDEPLIASKDVMASGSGDIQYLGENKTYSALETATKMIIISDNTATNMLIKRMGGKEVINQRFQAWGLQKTAINNALPDLEGTNTTSPLIKES